MNRVLIITRDPSDLSGLIQRTAPQAQIVHPDQLAGMDLAAFDALAILGGTQDQPLVFHPFVRGMVEDAIALGKRVFCEFVSSLGEYYFDPPRAVRYERLVCVDGDWLPGVEKGLILQKQFVLRHAPYYTRPTIRRLLVVMPHLRTYVTTPVDEQLLNQSAPALWLEESGTLMYCGLQLCNFLRARFAPKAPWKKVAAYIVYWLCQAPCEEGWMQDVYALGQPGAEPLAQRALAAAERGMAWYRNSGVLQDEGRGGVWEGIFSEINGQGQQLFNKNLRADCWGESALPFLMRYLLKKDPADLAVADRLMQATFRGFYTTHGPYRGMLRWTWEGWPVCYQDDVARAVMPVLWRKLLTGQSPCYDQTLCALDFLVATTGSDGLRPMRTDNIYLENGGLQKVSAEPGQCTSPHHVGYYAAALLLGYAASGEKRYADAAVRTMQAMMAVYPHAQRIQSQTQDLCRLILPLALLYGMTGDEQHRQWLYRVTADLDIMRHPSGAYLEWDSDYSAELHDAKQGNESSVFARNGDPIVDQLYALNWLPIAWLHAYWVTGDALFLTKWQQITAFLAATQVRSQDKLLDGAWTRVVDVERMEVLGMPDDVGWGPWCVETGWTMSQVISGLYMGLLEETMAPVIGGAFAAGKINP